MEQLRPKNDRLLYPKRHNSWKSHAVEGGGEEISIIDLILIAKGKLKQIKDIEGKWDYELGSNHYSDKMQMKSQEWAYNSKMYSIKK